METKQIIKQKLNEELAAHKRLSMCGAILNKTANHLYDAYRELESCLQYCDNPEIRNKLEAVKMMLGKDNQLAGHIKNEQPTVISELQEIMKDLSD
jgi:thermostable 8-oxoguanine DNA glycosylase